MVTCPTCGAENSDERAYCAACGVALPVEPAWRCRTCGAVNSMLNATCQDCGDLHEPLPQMIEATASVMAEEDGSNGNRRQAPGSEPEDMAAPAVAEEPPAEDPSLSSPANGHDQAMPAWLAEIATGADALPESQAEAPTKEGTPALPPWLEGMESVASAEPAPAAAPASMEQGGERMEMPAWDPGSSPDAAPLGSPALEHEDAAPPSDSHEAAQLGDMPEWLGSLVAEIGVPDADSIIETEGLASHPGDALMAAAEAETPPVEVPEWLQQEALPPWPEAQVETPTAPAAPEPQPVRTELPTWLRSIASMQAAPIAAPSDADGAAISESDAGPLAGVRGILPAEPIIAAPRPASMAPGLLITEEQAAQAELLQSILTAGVEPLPEPAPIRRRFANWETLVERWAIALALLAAIGLALFFQPGALPAPQPTAPAQSAFQVIENVRPEATVLVAFDYDTTSAGEMNPLATALLRHLAAHNVRVVALSTRPTGPALAQMALDAVAAEGANLSYGERAVNLGYLPGGPVGLSAFALNPGILNRDYRDGSDPWTKPAANGLVSLAQAQALVVLSADAASLRDWVEQVGVAFPNLPIVAATSAAGEPLARPYYEGRQIKGVVAGLPGADGYETLTGAPGDATTLREAQGFGQAVALLVLLAGALVALAQAKVMRRGKQDE